MAGWLDQSISTILWSVPSLRWSTAIKSGPRREQCGTGDSHGQQRLINAHKKQKVAWVVWSPDSLLVEEKPAGAVRCFGHCFAGKHGSCHHLNVALTRSTYNTFAWPQIICNLWCLQHSLMVVASIGRIILHTKERRSKCALRATKPSFQFPRCLCRWTSVGQDGQKRPIHRGLASLTGSLLLLTSCCQIPQHTFGIS